MERVNMKFIMIITCLFLFFLIPQIFRDNAQASFYIPREIDYNRINAIAIEGDYIWCATDGGIVRWNMRDGSYVIYTPSDGLSSYFVISCAADRKGVKWFAYAEKHTGGGGGVTSFDDETWLTYTPENSGLSGAAVMSIAVDNDNVKWFGADDGGISSFDDTIWTNYTPYSSNPVPPAYSVKVTAIAVDNDNVKWFGTELGSISSFDGIQWIYYPNEFGMIWTIEVDLYNTKWFVPFIAYLWRFDGETWEKIDNAPRNIYSIATDKSNNLWCGTLGVSVYDGAQWTNYTKEDGLLENVVNAIAIDDNNVKWIGTTKGLQSYDGEEWISYRIETSLIDSADDPNEFIIMSNHPNPFNPSTTITFTLPSSGFTSLVIYNIMGQEVRELVSETVMPGVHSVTWDGKDGIGNPVSSGVYISRLKMGGHIATGRMLLMK